jgi:hypothetical protein
MRHKKSKKKFCADETGRQKKANFCAPCRPDTSTRKWPDRKTNFVFLAARADKACADATGHKKVAAWADTGEWTATGQAKRQFLRALQLMTGCDRASQQKKLRALTLSVAVTGQKKDSAWHPDIACSAVTGQPQKKNNLRALRVDATGQKEKDSARLKKNCSWQTCADRPAWTDLRWPVRDRFNRSSMPVQPVLARMVLVKSGEKQLSWSSAPKFSWPPPAELESSAGQASWASREKFFLKKS